MANSFSLRGLAAAFEQIMGSQPIGFRQASMWLRWEQGWQGAGPLSARSLQYTVGGQPLSETFRLIDGQNPPKSVRQAYARLGFPLGGGVTRLPNEPVSVGQMAKRIQSSKTVQLRFLSYNTYLLQGLQPPFGQWIDEAVGWDALEWFDIPFGGALLVKLGLTSLPNIAVAEILKLAGFTPSKVIKTLAGIDLNGFRVKSKPALEARALELPGVLSAYDLCCLCEVMTQESRNSIFHGLETQGGNWAQEAGPDESGAWTLAGSGLYFLAKNRRIVKSERLVYSQRGEKRRDTDAWANKGAMLNVIDLGFGKLEVYQTHFYYGGDLPEVRIPGVDVPILYEPTLDERRHVRREELRELADFYQRHHQPENVAVITGDFNMNGANVLDYADIRRTMDSLNMRDLWTWDVYRHPPNKGYTCRFTDGDSERWERDFSRISRLIPEEPDGRNPLAYYCDDLASQAAPRAGVGRYDYVFVENPTPAHQYTLEVSRPVRRPFPRSRPSDNESYLSDHLGLDIVLYLSPR